MKKKYYFFLPFILLLIIQCKKDYIDTIENYFKYLKNDKNKKAYDLLSFKDKNVISFEEYRQKNYSTPISKNITKRIKYKIINSNLSETKRFVIVKVEITQPDLVRLYTLIPELLNDKYNEKQINKIFNLNNKIIENNCIKIIKDYKLVLENNKWKIFADFEKEKYIYNLVKEADEYYDNNEYNKALLRYEEALDFENSDKVLERISIIKEKLFYIEKYIKINYNILKKSKNGAIIDITIRNNGTIIVKKVLVDFLFYNNNTLVQKERQEIIDSIKDQIGFEKEIRKKVVFENFKVSFSKINCVISAIEF